MKLVIVVLGLSLALLFAASPAIAQCTDVDLDGYYCEPGCGTAQDCNDASATTHPGAVELCDAFDNDCNGEPDDGTCARDCASPDRGGSLMPLAATDAWVRSLATAWDGVGHGVVWADTRTGGPGVFFRWMNGASEPEGPEVRLSSNAGYVALAWTGTEFGVAWLAGGADGFGIYFARVDRLGNKLGSDVFVSANNFGQPSPALVWTGTQFALAAIDFRDGVYDVFFKRLTREGAPLGPETRLTDGMVYTAGVDLAWNGTAFGLAFSTIVPQQQPKLAFLSLDNTGVPLSTTAELPGHTPSEGSIDLEWSGLQFLLAWSQYHPAIGSEAAFLQGVELPGSFTGPPRLLSSAAAQTPRVAWTGSELGVVFGGYSGIRFRRFSELGEPIGEEVRLAASGWDPTIERNGGGYAVVWRGGTGAAVVGTSVRCDCVGDGDGDGWTHCSDCDDSRPEMHPFADQLCNRQNDDCDDPNWPIAPAFESDEDGDNQSECEGDCNDLDSTIYHDAPDPCDGVVNNCRSAPSDDWDDDEDGLTECAGDCDDTQPDINPTASEQCNWRDDDCDGLVDGPSCDGPCGPDAELGTEVQMSHAPNEIWFSEHPLLAWNGSHYGLLRNRSYANVGYFFGLVDRFGRRISPEVDFGYVASTSPEHAAMAASAEMFAIAWTPQRSVLKLSRVTASGSRAEPDLIIVEQGDGETENPTLVWDGSAFALAWHDFFIPDQRRHAIKFRRISQDGAFLGPEVVVSDTVTASSRDPSLARGADGFGIAWVDTRDGDPEIYFTRLDNDGNLLGSHRRITTIAGQSVAPSLVWNGVDFAIAWQDARADAPGVYFARVDPSGNVVGTERLVSPGGTAPKILWTGAEYRLTWLANPRQLFAVRLDLEGTVLDSPTNLSNPSFLVKHVHDSAWSGTESVAVWTDTRTGLSEVYLARYHSTCADLDQDGFPASEDCDDSNGTVYPGAPELCDGVSNNCRLSTWPSPPVDESDQDSDGFRICQNDCNDVAGAINPGRPESCNSIDDNCDGVIDDGGSVLCDDGNACTVGDNCGGGVCVSGDALECPALDQCHAPGACDPATGICGNPIRADGTSCNDNDLCTTGEACLNGSCIPAFSGLVEPNPRTNGYYKRLCQSPHTGDQMSDADAACVGQITATFAGISTVAEICAVLEQSQTNGDTCGRTEADLMALALNICRARVCTAQSIDSQCGGTVNVGQSLAESDAILDDSSRDFETCSHAKCLDEELNTGRALELNSLTLRLEGTHVRLDWTPPHLNDGSAHPNSYNVWRRVQGSLAPFTRVTETTDTTFVDVLSGDTSFEYEVTALMN